MGKIITLNGVKIHKPDNVSLKLVKKLIAPIPGQEKGFNYFTAQDVVNFISQHCIPKNIQHDNRTTSQRR